MLLLVWPAVSCSCCWSLKCSGSETRREALSTLLPTECCAFPPWWAECNTTDPRLTWLPCSMRMIQLQRGRSWKLPHNNVYTYEIQQSNASAAIYRHFTLGSLAFDQISWTKEWEMLMKVSQIVSFVSLKSKDSFFFFAIKNNKEKQQIHSVRNWNQQVFNILHKKLLKLFIN